jgi:DNA polymerase-3 subunit alpha
MSNFCHLHLHTQYSVLDGAIKINECVQCAKERGQPAVAMTDHGNMHGAIEFYEQAKKAGVKPIIGCEIYITSGSRFDKTPKDRGGQRTHHLTLLAKDRIGYRNLCKLVSAGYIEGFYHKPRVDFELLSELSSGIVCLSGCLSSEFAQLALNEDLEKGSAYIDRFVRLFGEDFFLEIQPHQIPEQQKLNAFCRELGRKHGIPLVATNDCHYLSPDDHYAQEVLMCISTGKLISDQDRIKHEGVNLSFKSYEEMLEALPQDEEAIRNTVAIAERCNVEFDFNTYHMPLFDPPQEETLEEYFAIRSREGLSRRAAEAGGLKDEPVYTDRLEEEIKLINQMGFAGYFLVVSDFIGWAKENGIPVGPGRGSAAGSLVAWALYITEVDPIEHNLLFERFLNPERVSLPDIDIDFCINGRSRVIEYVTRKYGKEKVAQICTFGTLKAKAAVKDVGRVLGLSYAETDRIAKLIPAPRQGFDYPLDEALKMEPKLKEYAEGEGQELISLARKLEGLSRHTSTHAAGIVIGDRALSDHLPLMVDKEGQVVTQLSMGYVEKIGLVKFDFLGLKTLTVLHEAVRLIAEGTGRTINLNTLPLQDPKTYQLISAGKTIGVFQLESSGITDMVSRLKPSCFEDIVAILALYRPGPLDSGMAEHYINRKHKREPVRYLHPLLEPTLKDTYGIILYQEQIMQIARDIGGYSLGEADLLRRAMGKKKPEEMAKHRDSFISGAKKRGVEHDIAVEIFDQMETFARYGFNRSHSVAYALISFQTAWLKAHYPVYFMAALMTFEMDDTDKVLKNLNECREMKIKVRPPDVNSGKVGFDVENGQIIFGLAAIKGIGEKAVENLLAERGRKGAFKGLFDFCLRMDSSLINRRGLEHLIKAGAFDWSGRSRHEMFSRLDEILKAADKERESKASAQISLFGSSQPVTDENFRNGSKAEWPVNVKLAHEKEALGFYLSGHPLQKYQADLERLGCSSINQLAKRPDGSQVLVAGVITFLKLKNTRKGDRYATFVLEDMLDTIEVIVWPDTYQKVYASLTSEEPVLVSGKLDVTDERALIIAANIEQALALRDRRASEAFVRVNATRFNKKKLAELKSVLTSHRGEIPVKLILHRPDHSETVLSLNFGVNPSEDLANAVESLLGEPAISFR